jgi:hypothetical protein
MKSIFSFIVLISLSLNVVFAGGDQEADNRTIRQSDANYRDLLCLFYKGTNTELTEEIVTNYIRDFSESDYNYRQNEFEWPAVLERHRTELASRINNANLSAEYTFQTGSSLGNYNFDLGGFDVGFNIEYLFLRKRGLSIGEGSGYTELNSKAILIFLSNPNNYNFLSMDRDRANALINSRTRDGNVNRNITLHISFNISNFFPDTGIFLIAQMSNSVSARITKIDVYDGDTKIGELTPKTPVSRPSIEQPSEQSSRPVFYVNDSAESLSSETITYINEKSASINSEKGVHFIIATVTTTGDLSVEDYALQRWYEWIGSAANSNAVLFLIKIMPTRWDWQLYWGNGNVISAIGGENILNTIQRVDRTNLDLRRYDAGIKAIYDAMFDMF